MKQKVMLLMLAVVAAMSAQAQIGYKGQVTAAVDGGITHLGGYVGAARIGAYLSPHSVLRPAMMPRWEIRSMRRNGSVRFIINMPQR